MSESATEELPFRRLVKAVYWMFGVVLMGTVGYVCVEGWGVADSFFMTVITISTVGYGETHSLSANGRVFTSVLIFVSLISMTGWTAILTSFVVESDHPGHIQQRNLSK